MVDSIADGIVRSETRSPLVILSPSRADLIVRAAQAGLRLAIVSDERSRLTEPLRSALAGGGGRWIVRGPSGLRDGLTGRALASLVAAFDDPVGGSPGSPDTLRLDRPLQTQLVVSMSLRHRADDEARVGGAVEAFAALSGSFPAGWAPHEPVDRPWDPATLTAFARERMPNDSRLVVAGSPDHPVSGTITVSRTRHGVEEIDEVLVGVGRPGTAAADAAVAAVPEVLAALAEPGQMLPLFVFVGMRTGSPDLSTGPFLAPGVQPLALLFGATTVRDLKLDPGSLRGPFVVRVVGRPRTPSIVIGFPGATAHGWSALLAFVDEIGIERVRDLLGLDFADPRWQQLREF
ncbi:MAG: DUF6177 family protein [Pseudolysinimonas sp.]|uniref:DUF6177 family protein n=1 Tax=Pseudolysinimonas sp. TaxID=2680009 RepID=UPI003262D05A